MNTLGPAATEPEPVSPAVAAATRWGTIVVGAGPAGTAAAIHLARAGARVLLVERGGLRRTKVCGCCLSPAALAELRDLDPGLGATPRAAVRWQPLDRVRLCAGGREAVVALPPGAVLSREALDARLTHIAWESGCGWLPDTTVTAAADDGTGVTLTLRTGSGERLTVAGDACVLATGLGGGVRIADRGPDQREEAARTVGVPGGRSRAGAGRPAARTVTAGSRLGCGMTLATERVDLPPGELAMVVGRGGYCGIVRLEDGRIDVAAALDPGQVAAGGPRAAVAAILHEAGGRFRDLGLSLPATGLRTTPLLTGHRGLVAGRAGRVFLVGDAAGYVEPFTGEGIGWALAGGRLVATALSSADALEQVPALRCGSGQPGAAARYAAAHRAAFGAAQARCRRVAAVVRWPGLVAVGIGAARLGPRLAARLVPFATGGAAARGASA